MPAVTDVQVDLSDYLSYCGKDLPQPEQHNYEVTRDGIRHFCYSFDENNALYLDTEFARQTRWGGIIAPPGYLYSHGNMFNAWARHVGTIKDSTGRIFDRSANAREEWEFYQPVHLGDVIISHSKPMAAEVKHGTRMGIMALVQSETRFTNQRGEIVAKQKSFSFRFSVQRQTEMKPLAQSYKDKPKPELTRARQGNLGRRLDQQKVFFEDIQEGMQIPPWDMGLVTPSHGMAFESYTAHIHRPSSGEDNPLIAGGVLPGMYAVGVLRIPWFGSLLTRWMGPNGWIHSLLSINREWVLVGYRYVCKGEVIRKYVENGRGLIECELTVSNEFGDLTNPGWAKVEVPFRNVPPQ